MGMAYPLVSSSRVIRVLDVVLALWVIGWVAFGVVIALEVRRLTKVSDTLVASSQLLGETGVVLGSLRDVPIVGENVTDLEQEVESAAATAAATGRASRANIRSLSVLLGVAIALIPTVPLAGLYLPMRLAWIRDVRAVGRALAERDGEPLLDEFLARRATEKLSYRALSELHDNPWRDVERGDYEDFSRQELRRLGLAPEEPR
jgi:hypothetical protein